MHVSAERVIMARLNLDNFVNTSGNDNIQIEGLCLEFEPEELPALLKSGMPVLTMIKSVVEDNNSKEWEKLCSELNTANEKLRETQAENRGLEAKLEAKTRGFDRLLEEKKSLKEEIENRNAEIAELREELFKARLSEEYCKRSDEKLDPNSSGVKLWD